MRVNDIKKTKSGNITEFDFDVKFLINEVEYKNSNKIK